MGLLDFIHSVFNKNRTDRNRLPEQLAEKLAEQADWTVGQLSGEISTLQQSVNGLDTKLKASAETLGALTATWRKFDIHQQEISVQLEEMSELLQADDSGTRLLIDALIVIASQIEDFYLFAAEDVESPLFAQAAMMWSAARKSLPEAGLTIVNGEGIPLDSRLHAPVQTGVDDRLPDGYVLKILASGYVYEGRVVRRASVVVNKKNQQPEGEI